MVYNVLLIVHFVAFGVYRKIKLQSQIWMQWTTYYAAIPVKIMSLTAKQTVIPFSSGFSIVKFVATTVPLKQSVFLWPHVSHCFSSSSQPLSKRNQSPVWIWLIRLWATVCLCLRTCLDARGSLSLEPALRSCNDKIGCISSSYSPVTAKWIRMATDIRKGWGAGGEVLCALKKKCFAVVGQEFSFASNCKEEL